MPSFFVELEIPDLSAVESGLGYSFLNVFIGNVPEDFKSRALQLTYIRLVDTALRQYESGRLYLEDIWSSGDRDSVPIGKMIGATGYFEACISNMHRAIKIVSALKKNRYVQQDLKILLPKKLRFIQEPVAGRLREMRNAVHHSEKDILDGVLSEDTGIALAASGPKIERGTDIIKYIDRLKIGQHEIKFVELCQWLREMAKCAKYISEYSRKGS